jgi:hypothetical protein
MTVIQSDGTILPNWLGWNYLTNTLSGTPGWSDKDLTVKVIGDDKRGGTVE